jgi:hypothetical protein
MQGMKEKWECLFEFGVDGGGAAVYRTKDNRVIESGSSGGMMEEWEDPIISWKKEYANFEEWWNHFKESHGSFWFCFYPLFIHEDVKPIIRQSVDNYVSDRDPSFYEMRKSDWDMALHEPTGPHKASDEEGETSHN